MHVFPSEDEVEKAAALLVDTYRVSAQSLGRLFGTKRREQANSILQALGRDRLSTRDVARLLIQREGAMLFSGSGRLVRELRQHILNEITDEQVRGLFERNPPSGKNITAVSRMRKPLSKMKWSSGKRWARDFVTETGFPAIFAGIEQGEKVPTIVVVPPLRKPPKLADFQEGLKKRMLDVLERELDRTRCVVTLPTGGGKTRVAVEAFIDWMQPRFAEGKYLVWIAQSEELCEQAIACIEQMWGSREFVSPLRIYRYFGGRDIPAEELRGGAVVTSIQQLHHRVKSRDKAIEDIFSLTGAMIIDEAHRAVSSMYDTVLDRAEEICNSTLFPICGLTATPGRAGMNSPQEIVKLVGRFDVHLIKPELGNEYITDPLRFFREHKYLAHAHHVVCRSGLEYELTDEELGELERVSDLPPRFLKRLAADRERNLLVVRRLLELPRGTPTLVYACTVEHAHFLAAILTAQGRKAVAVSADTSMTIRRGLVQNFKDGKIEFLCNYGVLTTGFDAPLTECIVLCRPTTREVLYEQIIGRGLRGRKFGGTEKCTIIDFADNIRRLGPPLAYARFLDFWTVDEAQTDAE